MLDPSTTAGVQRLRNVVDDNETALKDSREDLRRFVKEYGGRTTQQTESGELRRRKTYVNFLRRAAVITTQHLASQQPRCLCIPDDPQYIWWGNQFAEILNRTLAGLNFADTLWDASLFAWFSMGIVQCGSQLSGKVEIDPLYGPQPYAEPFCKLVSPETFGYDTQAARWDETEAEWTRTYLYYDEIMDDDSVPAQVKDDLRRERFSLTNDDGTDKLQSLPYGAEEKKRLYDYIECYVIWVRRENLIITLPVKSKANRALHVKEWDGLETGPFPKLSYADIPGTLQSSSPASDLFNLHMVKNTLFRKLVQQAKEQKNVLAHQPGEETAAGNLAKAMQGALVAMENPDAAKVYTWPGPDPLNQNFTLFVDQQFDQQAGNLNLLGGLAPSAGTLGQEELLAEQSSKLLDSMQKRVTTFAAKIYREIGWRRYTEKLRSFNGWRNIPGIGQVPWSMPPELRPADFLNLNFEIAPYSYKYRSPQERLAALERHMGRALNTIQLGMQQGVIPNVAKFLEYSARYEDLPEAEDMVLLQQPIPHLPPEGQQPNTQPNVTRTNVRPSTRTGGGDMISMMQANTSMAKSNGQMTGGAA